MATGTSIVGTWDVFVDWGCDGAPASAGQFVFNANGSWTYASGGGRWIQIEGMCFFNFTTPANLVYTANVTRNAMVGIQGYAQAAPNPGSGCWWATRQGSPHALAAAAIETAAVAKGGHDYALGPQTKK